MYDPDIAINEQYEEIQRLKAELAAHKENEGDECPLCHLEEKLEALEKACIEFYCGTITKEEWRQAVRESPEGQRLIALAEVEESKFCRCEKPYITYRAVPPMCLHCGKEKGRR